MTNAANIIKTSKANKNVIFALNPFTNEFEKFETLEAYKNDVNCEDSPIVNGVQYNSTTELEFTNVLTVAEQATDLTKKEVKAIAKYVELNDELVELNEELEGIVIYEGLDKRILKERTKQANKLEKAIAKVENKMDKITNNAPVYFMETLNAELGGSYFYDFQIYG